jgi:hypothetical protein
MQMVQREREKTKVRRRKAERAMSKKRRVGRADGDSL